MLKPAKQTPLSVLRFMELAEDVVPDGVVNVVTGYGEEAGEPISEHEDIYKIAFTGSTAVGKQIMQNAAQNVTDVTLELGGTSPHRSVPGRRRRNGGPDRLHGHLRQHGRVL